MTEKIADIVYRLAITFAVVMIFLMLAFGLSGCASGDGYQRYLSAQSAAIKAQKPMLKITAQPGQPISGLASIEVYGPGISIQQEKDNEWARVVTSGLQVVGVVGGIVAAGNASANLVESVGGLGVSTNIVNDNRTWDTHAITDSYNATATPTVVNPVVVTQPAPIVVQPQVIIP